ncbi:MAG: UDP-N-acetylmuramoyl-tripeptide--D-alanyl-D-alanine ligase [Pseudorhodobacter sp.]|nr:UDP-N-acetylmuramoyl-tripeptide--D-alanyl-D-alanine ligase [Pseudorhodobacter sp.]
MAGTTGWTLGSIAAALGGQLVGNAQSTTTIKHFRVAAWGAGPDSLFIPIYKATAGMTDKAIASGARAVVATEPQSNDIPTIVVDDVYSRVYKLAEQRRREFKGALVGITGSAGKSTTKTMLGHTLEADKNILVSQNNQNLTPFIVAALCGLEADVDYAILELAVLTPDMVGSSSIVARPHVAAITSIGMNHAGLQTDEDPQQGIIRSKCAIFSGLEAGGTAILPTVDKYHPQLLDLARASKRVGRFINCGHGIKDDVRLLDLVEQPTFSDVTISVDSKQYRYRVPMAGIHMVNNSLLVAGALLALGEQLDRLETLRTYFPPSSSTRRFMLELPDRKAELIEDAIISSPHQVRAVLQTLAQRQKAKRRLFIFGDMTMLGAESEKQHRDLAREIETAGVDELVAIGEMSGHLADELSIPVTKYKNIFAAEPEVLKHIQDRDLVILKASGQMNFKRILKAMKKQGKLVPAETEWMIENAS